MLMNGQDAVGQQPSLQEYIPLAHGSIFYTDNGAGGVDLTQPADVLGDSARECLLHELQQLSRRAEQPGAIASGARKTNVVYNQIHIDPLTGKGAGEHQDVQ